MPPSTITLEVDADSAAAYATATEEDRRRIQLLLKLRLRELTAGPGRSLREVMDEIGAHAEAQGLTPQILDALLRDA